jgi:phage shock protein C
MFCTQCGTHLADDSRFCTTCGKPALIELQPSAPGVAEAPRRLRRNRTKKKIAGVCAGFADYFGMDYTLMRLIWIGLVIMPPYVGLIAYGVSWAVLPKD